MEEYLQEILLQQANALIRTADMQGRALKQIELADFEWLMSYVESTASAPFDPNERPSIVARKLEIEQYWVARRLEQRERRLALNAERKKHRLNEQRATAPIRRSDKRRGGGHISSPEIEPAVFISEAAWAYVMTLNEPSEDFGSIH